MVEDDDDIRELIGLYLQRESLEAIPFASPVAFLTWLDKQKDPPDLVILDLMLPELSGGDVIKRLRKQPAYDAMPILVCSAKATETDVVLTLGLGADTYIRKPFNPHELVAQVVAMLRRADARRAAPSTHVFTAGELSVDTARHVVTLGDRPLDLTPSEYRILAMLVEHKGTVISREELLRAVGETDAVERVIDVHVTNIRHKLGEAARLLHTSRSFGYYVEEDQ
ncbi:MAG TPA: response regulator transcription factor [Candidatus Cryosericum sp.]|nr:response regulator transcription factor [Candidatus Cryosericum sp.]HPS69886.1 response regulator transcription factor [Candidatus Cryosericum sp.]